MLTLTVAEAPAAQTGDDPVHLVCCDPDLAMCGLDVSDGEWDCDPDRTCPLCGIVEASGLPCPVSGCAGGSRYPFGY